MPTTEIVKSNVAELQDLLAKAEKRIARLLPKHLKASQMIGVTLELVHSDNLLSRCEPESVLQGVLEASELGLLLIRNLGHGYLVPFKNGTLTRKLKHDVYEAKFIIGYRGFVELVLRDGQASSVFSRIVHPEDQFSIVEGTRHEIQHIPKIEGASAYAETGEKRTVTKYPGTPYEKQLEVPVLTPTYRGAYAVVIYAPMGAGFARPADFEWMPQAEIEKVRRVSKAQSEDSPWQNWPEEMIKKTPIRRLCKRLRLTPEVLAATVRDEYRELGVETEEERQHAYDITAEIREPQRRGNGNGEKKEAPEAPKSEPPKEEKPEAPTLTGENVAEILRAAREVKKSSAELARYVNETYRTMVLTDIPATELPNLLAWIKGGKAAPAAEATPAPSGKTITKAQAQKLEDVASKSGWAPLEWLGYLGKAFSVSKTAEIPAERFDEAMKVAEGGV
jgi:recombination protein RecT